MINFTTILCNDIDTAVACTIHTNHKKIIYFLFPLEPELPQNRKTANFAHQFRIEKRKFVICLPTCLLTVAECAHFISLVTQLFASRCHLTPCNDSYHWDTITS